jgi:ADP-dependent NAD(P)H-hydrate dehydratase / NAD(P)H-hydrate epimerase
MISSSEMKALENNADISKLTLMENAGRKVAEVIEEKYDLKDKRVLVVSYHGNNGGDGFVAARQLAEKAEVEILFLGEESRLKPEAAENLKRIEENALIQFIGLDYVDFDDYDIIIDAILGMGIEGSLKPIIQSTIDKINSSKAVKVSVDVPSGLNPDNGEIHDIAIDADLIITFHDIKNGLKELEDKVLIVDIGIPKS